MPPAIPAPALITEMPTFAAVSRTRPCAPDPAEPDAENRPLAALDARLLDARLAAVAVPDLGVAAAEREPPVRRAPVAFDRLEPLEPAPLVRAAEAELRLAAVPELSRAPLLAALLEVALELLLADVPDLRADVPDLLADVPDLLADEPLLDVERVLAERLEGDPFDGARLPDVRRPVAP